MTKNYKSVYPLFLYQYLFNLIMTIGLSQLTSYRAETCCLDLLVSSMTGCVQMKHNAFKGWTIKALKNSNNLNNKS